METPQELWRKPFLFLPEQETYDGYSEPPAGSWMCSFLDAACNGEVMRLSGWDSSSRVSYSVYLCRHHMRRRYFNVDDKASLVGIIPLKREYVPYGTIRVSVYENDAAYGSPNPRPARIRHFAR
jgi:hypothetical protein